MVKQNAGEAFILQKGNIFFLFRPKLDVTELADTKGEAQRFLMVLNPENSSKYVELIIGKKELPRGSGRSYFALVGKNFSNLKEFVNDLNAKYYQTKTRGKRKLPYAHYLGHGKYLIVNYKQHTYLLYKLDSACEIENSQASFNIKNSDQFVIQVKNTVKYPSSSSNKKTTFPQHLIEAFSNYKFIPLMPIDFIFYEGVEILLNSRGNKPMFNLNKELEEYLSMHSDNEMISHLISFIDASFVNYSI